MSTYSDWLSRLPSEQRTLAAKCRHGCGELSEFSADELADSVYHRFHRIVEKYPERMAIQSEEGSLSYEQLDRRANQIAGAILQQQGEAQTPIAVFLRNSANLLAAILGAWQAGKTIALLDPLFPEPRTAAMLADSHARIVITDSGTAMAANKLMPRRSIIDMTVLPVSSAAQYSHRPSSADDFAGIFFTSGSTGQPKAVVLSQRNLLHQAMLFTHAYGICRHDRLALLSSGSGSALTTALIALLNGAAVSPFDVRSNGVNRLSDWLVQDKISIGLLGTPLFRALCSSLDGGRAFPDLRLLRLRSDALRPRDLESFKTHFPSHCLLVNGLSTSETGLLTLGYFDHDSVVPADEVPVGYPVQDKEILLLDDDGDEIGFNRTGEIVVRSRYLAHGYWQRPDLTAAKFTPESPGSDQRLCFTGDLGMRLPSGLLLHKGRKDFRVKVRGYGVEIGEVEKTLREHAAICDVVVVSNMNASGDSQLIAYIIVDCPNRLTATELRKFLGLRLPQHMIPARFVTLDKLPLTPNGKIDRSALPQPDNLRPELDTEYQSPQGPIETELAAIWALVLGLDRVGIRDNFFDLGGHSLIATRLVSQVANEFHLDIPLRALFEAPTIAEMATIIARHNKQVGNEVLDRLLSEVETMSEHDAQRQLSERSTGRKSP